MNRDRDPIDLNRCREEAHDWRQALGQAVVNLVEYKLDSWPDEVLTSIDPKILTAVIVDELRKDADIAGLIRRAHRWRVAVIDLLERESPTNG